MAEDVTAAFVDGARRYVAHIDRAARWRRPDLFLARAYRLLAELLPLALALPDVQVSDDDLDDEKVVPREDCLGHDAWQRKYVNLNSLLGDRNVFWEVFDPRQDEGSIAGTIADALAEVWSHLKVGLVHIDSGHSVDGAVWTWRWTFWSVWGHHVTDVLRLVTADFDDESWNP